MNNRYICKAKRKDNNEWVTGYYVFQRKRSGVFGQLISELDFDRHLIIDLRGNSHEVIPETVGQCTGMKDKNGKWIFEGDVVNALFDFEMPIKSVCVFKDGSFGLLAKQHGIEHFHPFTSLCNIKYEVIGNIHNTPNLFKLEHDSLCETETYKVGDTE